MFLFLLKPINSFVDVHELEQQNTHTHSLSLALSLLSLSLCAINVCTVKDMKPGTEERDKEKSSTPVSATSGSRLPAP